MNRRLFGGLIVLLLITLIALSWAIKDYYRIDNKIKSMENDWAEHLEHIKKINNTEVNDKEFVDLLEQIAKYDELPYLFRLLNEDGKITNLERGYLINQVQLRDLPKSKKPHLFTYMFVLHGQLDCKIIDSRETEPMPRLMFPARAGGKSYRKVYNISTKDGQRREIHQIEE